MTSNRSLPIIGVVVAIAITTTMDATGYSPFSALPLLPLMVLFWIYERMSRREIGMVKGPWAEWGIALLYPLTVMGAIVVVALAAGAVDLSQTDWSKTGRHIALISVSTFLMTILTEEGFFRGWLWASLQRRDRSAVQTLIWTSLAFSLWHLSAVSLDTGFDLPWKQIPIFMVNATLLGAVWGLMRMRSGSIVVASLSHGVWNGLAYTLFGFSTNIGALGIENTAIFGPEVGVFGVVLNALFFILLWRGSRSLRSGQDPA